MVIWQMVCAWKLIYHINRIITLIVIRLSELLYMYIYFMVGWLVVFNVLSAMRSFRDDAPIYCPLFIVASLAVMVIHCCNWFEQKRQL